MNLFLIILVSVLRVLGVKIKVLTGMIISAVVLVVHIMWSTGTIYYFKIELYEMSTKLCPIVLSYDVSINPDYYPFQQSVNDIIKLTLSCLLFLSVAINLLKLFVNCITRKEDKHMILLTKLSIVFFMSESMIFCMYLIDWMGEQRHFSNPFNPLQRIINIFTLCGIVLRCSTLYSSSQEYAATLRKYTNKLPMKTTKKSKLPTTTTSSPDYEFYEYDDGMLTEKTREATIVEEFFSVFGFLMCIFHFFILTRKNLRADITYFFLLIICILDFFFFSGKIIWSACDKFMMGDCDVRSSIHQHIRIGIIAIQGISRNVTSILVIVMAVLKMIPVKLKVLFGVLISLGVLGGCATWHIWANSHYEFWDYSISGCGPNPKTKYSGVGLSIDPEFSKFQKYINECITITLVVPLATCTVILFLKLREVVKTRNGEDDIIVLLFLLTLSFFITEFLDSSVILFEKFLLKPYFNIQSYYVRFQVILNTIIIINTTTHPFLCMLTSSEYFNTAKKYMCRRKKVKSPTPDAPSVSTIRVTNGSNPEY